MKPRRIKLDRNSFLAGRGALGLGDVQPEKPQGHLERFTCTPRKAHQHQWLDGAVNRVCSVCGLTEPK